MLVTAEQKKFLVLVMDLAYQKKEGGGARKKESKPRVSLLQKLQS